MPEDDGLMDCSRDFLDVMSAFTLRSVCNTYSSLSMLSREHPKDHQPLALAPYALKQARRRRRAASARRRR
eukprot:572765-Prymnesium_polylepis.1